MTGMCVNNTPVEDHREQLGLWVKREDLCCPGGPNFSKTRGVYAHIAKRPEHFIGVLDTAHSQGGWAVARACALLNKTCVEFYPVRKADRLGPLPEVQQRCLDLGAQVLPLQAGRSAILYHTAKKWMANHPDPAMIDQQYMMPNALKLPEMVSETAAEVARTWHTMDEGAGVPDTVVVSASSATIAAGVLAGLHEFNWHGEFIVHLGYSRPERAVRRYMEKIAAQAFSADAVTIIDEGYAYADRARPGPLPPFACNEFYDLKAFRWWMAEGRAKHGEALLWNVG